MFRPILATDWDIHRIKWPKIGMPKIDGVRGLNVNGAIVGRSLKTFDNRFTVARFSLPELDGLDGELALGDIRDHDLCRRTTSAITTIAGEPDIHWYIFDCQARMVGYAERLKIATAHVKSLNLPYVHFIQGTLINSIEEFLKYEEEQLQQGFEGVILRSLDGLYKYGRTTVREGTYLRVKRFVEEDAVVLEVLEGSTNNNSPVWNALGFLERSTHAENMTPSGIVGTLVCMLVNDVHHNGSLLFKAGDIVRVAPGRMTDDQGRKFMENPSLIVGKTIKFKFFPKGGKDKPRFPTFQSIRAKADMVTT